MNSVQKKKWDQHVWKRCPFFFFRRIRYTVSQEVKWKRKKGFLAAIGQASFLSFFLWLLSCSSCFYKGNLLFFFFLSERAIKNKFVLCRKKQQGIFRKKKSRKAETQAWLVYADMFAKGGGDWKHASPHHQKRLPRRCYVRPVRNASYGRRERGAFKQPPATRPRAAPGFCRFYWLFAREGTLTASHSPLSSFFFCCCCCRFRFAAEIKRENTHKKKTGEQW